MICLMALLNVAYFAQAQENDSVAKKHELNIGLHILGHGEVRKGGLSTYGAETEGDNVQFVMGRTRLTLGYKQPYIEAKVIGQNTAIWGMKGDGNFSIYEAWAKLSMKIGLFAQIGRQALSYDDERIIGPNDWAMAANSHDVLKLGYEGYGHKFHAILAYNQNAENLESGSTFYQNLNTGNGSQLYKTMQIGWYHYDVPKFPLGASLLFMNIGMQAGERGGEKDHAPHIANQQLLGGFVSFHPKWMTAEAAYYKQLGKDENDMEIDGWMASVKVVGKPIRLLEVIAGYDYLSGDDKFPVVRPGSFGMIYHEKQRSFRPLYGSHHKFYGAMDYFYTSAYMQGFSPGLQNLYGGAMIRPFKGFSFKTLYHYLAINTDLEGLGKTLGHEIELEAAYDINKAISVQAGFSYMTGTETLDRLKRETGTAPLRWGWLSLIVSPNLFSLKW